MAEHIPDDVMVHILERLPIKSLLRFTCVSKWWRSIILYDHQFAKSQFQRFYETSPTRLLLSTSSDGEFESIDTEMPLTSGSVTKLTCPSEFKQPNHRVRILSSCNGLILLASTIYTTKNRLFASKFYIWNPSTGFFKKLPNSRNIQCVNPVGFGHLSATDDYKIIVKSQKFEHSDCWYFSEAEIFSSRANIWKTIQVPSNVKVYGNGLLVNEAIHWIKFPFHSVNVVIAFDLAKEEFRTIPFPTSFKRAETAKASMFRGCLCIVDCKYERNPTAGSFDVWVMREYDMADSWTKIFSTKVNNIPCWYLKPLLVTETSTFLDYSILDHDALGIESKLIKIVHHQEEVFEKYIISSGNSRYSRDAITFEESLLWLR